MTAKRVPAVNLYRARFSIGLPVRGATWMTIHLLRGCHFVEVAAGIPADGEAG